jgi:hypothetical protein
MRQPYPTNASRAEALIYAVGSIKPDDVADLARHAEVIARQHGGRRVEEERGAGPTGSRPFPFPAHQTGRALFEHPAFISSWKFRHEKTQYTQFPEYYSVRELSRAQRRHFVATSQEDSHALIDVVVDGPIGRAAIPLVEIWPRSSWTDSFRDTQSHPCESDAARTYIPESRIACRMWVFASFRVNPIRLLTPRVQSGAPAALRRLRITPE